MPTAAPSRPAAPVSTDDAAQLLLAFTRLARERGERPLAPRLQALIERADLAPRHLHALALIALEGPLSVSELARREAYALSTASLLVTQLADAGLVVRAEDADDRRRTVVSVAPAHRRDSEQALEARLAPLRRAVARMGPRRSRALLDGLAVVAEEFEHPAGPTARRAGARP